MISKRNDLYQSIWDLQDVAYDLMTEYDGIPHYYGDEFMYHTEGQVLDLIAQNPGITVTDIADITKKTTSACSQLVRKLKDRGCVEQIRNEKNNRKYNLTLTTAGEKVYEERKIFNQKCQKIMNSMLAEFSEEELKHHIRVQQKINEVYRGDIERSKEVAEQTVK